MKLKSQVLQQKRENIDWEEGGFTCFTTMVSKSHCPSESARELFKSIDPQALLPSTELKSSRLSVAVSRGPLPSQLGTGSQF